MWLLVSERLLFRECTGGALIPIPPPSTENHALQALAGLGRWSTREEWERACKQEYDLGQKKAQKARQVLLDEERVVRQHQKSAGRGVGKAFFAPAERERPVDWPEMSG